MADILQLYRTTAMSAGGHYNNPELRFLKETGRYPVAGPAFYMFGDGSGALLGADAPQVNQTPYIPYARQVGSKIIHMAGPGHSNSSYWISSIVTENGAGSTWGSSIFNATGPRGSGPSHSPAALTTGAPYKKIVNGGLTATTTCFLRANGELWSSGYNNTGMGARGSTSSLSFARAGTDLWTDVSLYHESAIGIKTDGTLWGWGANTNGRNGLGLTSGNTTTPTQIGTDTDWAKVFMGREGGFAIKTDGRLYGYGSNSSGCLGTGDTAQKTTPTQIGSQAGWVSASKSTSHSVFVHSDGTLWSVGSGSNFRRGVNTSSNTLTQIGTDTIWTDAVAGTASIMATTNIGGVWYAGIASDGMFATDSPMVRIYRGDPTRVSIAAGWRHYMIGY